MNKFLNKTVDEIREMLKDEDYHTLPDNYLATGSGFTEHGFSVGSGIMYSFGNCEEAVQIFEFLKVYVFDGWLRRG